MPKYQHVRKIFTGNLCLENTDPENIGSSSLVLFDVLNYVGFEFGFATQFLKAKTISFLLCSVCSSFIFVHIEEGLDGVSDNWQMAKILTDNWHLYRLIQTLIESTGVLLPS